MLNSANNGATGASDTSPSSGYIFGLTVFVMLSKIFVMISLLIVMYAISVASGRLHTHIYHVTKSLHLFFDENKNKNIACKTYVDGLAYI
jgi:uncharacterized membrane protein